MQYLSGITENNFDAKVKVEDARHGLSYFRFGNMGISKKVSNDI
jgi:hypothetical protein